MAEHLATAYLQVEPEWNYGSRDKASSVRGAKVVGVTQSRPGKPRAGVVIVKVNLQVPAEVFLPLQPEATIVVPAGFAEPHPVVVTAVDANESSTE